MPCSQSRPTSIPSTFEETFLERAIAAAPIGSVLSPEIRSVVFFFFFDCNHVQKEENIRNYLEKKTHTKATSLLGPRANFAIEATTCDHRASKSGREDRRGKKERKTRETPVIM